MAPVPGKTPETVGRAFVLKNAYVWNGHGKRKGVFSDLGERLTDGL